MKNKFASLLIAIAAVTSLVTIFSGCGGSSNNQIVLYQINDRHSHMHGIPTCNYDPTTTGDGTVGGAARWAKLFQDEKSSNSNTLIFDAGDYSMGTMLVAASSGSSDLDLMKEIGFSAATFGNHEFDGGPAMLAASINSAEQPAIPIVIANINFSDSDPRDAALKTLYGAQGETGKAVFPYIVLTTTSGKKLGIFGLMGIEAASVTNAAPVTFSTDMTDMAATAQEIVDTLRNTEEVDAVIALAHLGISQNGTSGESVELAKRVSGIDIIMSGHQHTPLEAPVAVACETESCNWTTQIMEAGNYGQFIGRYTLDFSGTEKNIAGSLIDIDDSLTGNSSVTSIIDGFVSDLEENFIPNFGGVLTGDYYQKLATSEFDLNQHQSSNNNISYLVADSLREKTDTDVAVISNGGDIRSSLLQTQENSMCLADAFISTPLGFGPDGVLGYPVVKFCLLLAELKAVLETTTCNYGLANNDYMMDLSGLRIVFDSSREANDRITRMTEYTSIDETGATTLLYNNGYVVDPFSLVSIATSIYDASFLTNFDLLPRSCTTGEQTSDLFSLIVRDASDNEVKLWYTFVEKLAAFSSGVPEIYNDDYPPNPIGPYWRRAWDTNQHACGGHSYCD